MGSVQFPHDICRYSSCFVCHSFATPGIPLSALPVTQFCIPGINIKYINVNVTHLMLLCPEFINVTFVKSQYSKNLLKHLCHGIQIVSYLFFSVYEKCSSMHANEMHLNQEFNYKCLIVIYRWDNCLSILIYKPFWDTVSNHNPDFDCILLNQDFWIWLSYKSLYSWFERLSWLPTNGCYRR